MNKYVAIFCIPAAAMQDWMTKVDEAERKTQTDKMMADWKTWRDEHKDAILEEGWPLGKTKRVSADGITDMKNDMNYVMVIQAESHDAATELIKSNPHLTIPTSYVEVMDSNMSGM